METIQINDRDYKYKFSNAVLSAFEKQCGIRLADFETKGNVEHLLIVCFKALQITAKVEGEEFTMKYEEFVSFYKILEIKGSFAHIIELSQITISKPGYSEMSCYVKPGNEEIGEHLKLKISTSVYNGKANYFLKLSRSEYLYEYTNGENGTYCSWYA